MTGRRLFDMTIRTAVLAAIATTATVLAGAARGDEVKMQQATAPARPEIYAPFRLAADLSGLSENERRMLGLFIDASVIMDDLFWRQAYGDRDALLAGL